MANIFINLTAENFNPQKCCVASNFVMTQTVLCISLSPNDAMRMREKGREYELKKNSVVQVVSKFTPVFITFCWFLFQSLLKLYYRFLWWNWPRFKSVYMLMLIKTMTLCSKYNLDWKFLWWRFSREYFYFMLFDFRGFQRILNILT